MKNKNSIKAKEKFEEKNKNLKKEKKKQKPYKIKYKKNKNVKWLNINNDYMFIYRIINTIRKYTIYILIKTMQGNDNTQYK